MGRLLLPGGGAFSGLLAVASSDDEARSTLDACALTAEIVPAEPPATLWRFAEQYGIGEHYADPRQLVDRACLATLVLTALGGSPSGARRPGLPALRAAARLALGQQMTMAEAMALASEALIWPGPGLDEDGLPIRMAAVQKQDMPIGAKAVFAAAADAMCALGVWVRAAWMSQDGT